ncbi:hypothetical protein N0V90_001126 [Kalmusia sp. IMI 367209]|nr:hypothetical protein N0V90_001126 [Kalmusia sp. IMI 367209]
MGSSSATSHLATKILGFKRQPTFDLSKTLSEARGSFKAKPEKIFRFYTYAKSYWQDHILYVSEHEPIILTLSKKLIQIENGQKDIVKLLLSNDTLDINTADISYGQTPLLRAIEEGHLDIVKLLINNEKVDVNAKDNRDFTPLMWATRKGQKDIVR